MSAVSPARTLSVIIPALNEEDNLAGAVMTVLDAIGDRFMDYELLIFDDGSTDSTGQIADKLATHNSRIRVVQNHRNLGLGCSYTKGVELAKMEYVAWFPGDDEVPGQAVRAVLDAIGSAEIVVPYISNPHLRTWSRRLISASFVRLLNLLFGLRLRYFNGPCAYSRTLLSSVPIQSSGFACFAAILIRMILSGHSYVEIAIPTRTRQHGRTKAFRLKNLVSIFSTIAGLVWDVYVRDRRKYARVGQRIEVQTRSSGT
jgi:glycosyltransferase involved in cell wall biosynthesis